MTEHKFRKIAGVECYQVPDLNMESETVCGLCLFNRHHNQCHAQENDCVAEKSHFIEPTAKALEAHQLLAIAQRLKS